MAQYTGIVRLRPYDPDRDVMAFELSKGKLGDALNRARKIAKRNPAAGLDALDAVKQAALQAGDKRKAEQAANAQHDALKRLEKSQR